MAGSKWTAVQEQKRKALVDPSSPNTPRRPASYDGRLQRRRTNPQSKLYVLFLALGGIAATAKAAGVATPTVWNWNYGRRALSGDNARFLREAAERLSQDLAAVAYELRQEEKLAVARRQKRRTENQRRWVKWRAEDQV